MTAENDGGQVYKMENPGSREPGDWVSEFLSK